MLAIRLLTPWATRHELSEELQWRIGASVRLAMDHQLGDDMSQEVYEMTLNEHLTRINVIKATDGSTLEVN